MARFNLIWKLFAGYAVLILLTAALVSIVVIGRLKHDLLADTESNLISQVFLLEEISRPALARNDHAALQPAVAKLAGQTGSRFTVIAADGTVVVDSVEDPASMNNHAQRPEMAAALSERTSSITRYSQTVSAHYMYVARAVTRDGRHLGWVRAAVPLTSIGHRLYGLRLYIGLAALVVILISLVIGYFISRHLTGPLSQMTVVARAIAGGDYEQRLQIRYLDETGVLARALNKMSASLCRRINTIDTDRNRLRTILAGMVEGVVAVDTGEQVVHLNQAAGRMLAVVPDQCIGRRIWEVLRIPALTEVLKDSLGSEHEITGEINLPQPSGDRRIELLASPLHDGTGTVVGAVVVMHEVTQLRRLEEMRRDFVANVSHELKTPLTAINGIAGTLIDDPDMDEATRRHFIERVGIQADRLESLVSDLMTLNRAESDTSIMEKRPLDLREPAQYVLAEHNLSARGKRIDLKGELPGFPVLVVGDEETLRILLGNLVDNAIKYTPEGGRVVLSLTVDGPWAGIQVADNGIGIPPGHLERIFERFYRVDKARSREIGGTGLGLSIIKHVAQSHGGTTGVDSTVGQGSTFWVRLPLADSATAASD